MLSDKNKAGSASLMQGQYGTQSVPFEAHDEDSIERITVLGRQLTNPYLIPNVQQAYHNLGIYNIPVTVTNLYVRFKPTNVDQLVILDSVMEAQDLELFETPVDYEVLSEGDYYQDPNIPDEDITWQYAVVLPDFSFPAGITHETLAQIHIPGDDYTAVETEAERLASIQDSLNMQASAYGGVHPNIPQCPPGYEWAKGHGCVPILELPCPDGFHWNGTSCVADAPPPSPPAPAPDAAKPAGYIKVHDTNLNEDVPVRKARVVAKRWFKIQRTYTDNDGHFQITKRFKHKVKINVKFKNSDAQVRNVRGVRLWQMFFPVKKKLGVFSGNKSSINHIFIQYSNYSAKGNIYWTAATVHNAVQEYRDYAPEEGIASPPKGLKIFISKTSMAGNGGASPLFGKRHHFSISTQYVLFNISGIASIVSNIIAIIKGQFDMVIGYRYETNGSRDITKLLSDRIKETSYHELTHAGQFTALGGSWYSSFVSAEETAIINNFSSGYKPYGDGTNSNFSPIIALGESWAYYMGHFLADKRYGIKASCQTEQDGGTAGGTTWCNSDGTGHPHLDVEENFNPNLASDPFKWIPQGLFYDLRDPANETNPPNPINDLVSGYTNSQMFNAFKSTIFSLQDYRVNLLQTVSNPTSGQVTGLFFQYHY